MLLGMCIGGSKKFFVLGKGGLLLDCLGGV